jgi:hypothetical protein
VLDLLSLAGCIPAVLLGFGTRQFVRNDFNVLTTDGHVPNRTLSGSGFHAEDR